MRRTPRSRAAMMNEERNDIRVDKNEKAPLCVNTGGD